MAAQKIKEAKILDPNIGTAVILHTDLKIKLGHSVNSLCVL